MTFQEIINQDKPVLVNFFATWCRPCQMMSPILNEVKHLIGTVTIIKVNVDKNQQTAAAYQVQGVPTFVLIKNGNIIWRRAGIISANELKNLLTRSE